MKSIQDDIAEACEVLNRGGVILYPTDTIWGIGCDATNSAAVKRVYEIKRRADNKALIVLTDSMTKVDFYVDEVPEIAYDLVDLSDKPLTIIYSGARNLAPELLGEDGTVGIRVTQESFSQALCRRFRKAIPLKGYHYGTRFVGGFLVRVIQYGLIQLTFAQCQRRAISGIVRRNNRRDKASCRLYCRSTTR